jgi:hypothetical protein
MTLRNSQIGAGDLRQRAETAVMRFQERETLYKSHLSNCRICRGDIGRVCSFGSYLMRRALGC